MWVPVLLCVALTGLPSAPGVAGGAPAAGHRRPVDLDVLFVGAHPDDEAFNLSTFGRWDEYSNVKTGVVTITRGEGGGNAVGPEEGPPLGLLREAEERRAVRRAGIKDIFYLDTVDFYYTVSAALTEDVWGHDRTLEKIVRLVRETRPEVIVTMDPAPTPGNHGNHQYAARLATEAFYSAADPGAFPGQLAREGLRTWRTASLFRQGASVDATPTGPECAAAVLEPTDNVFAVWDGRWSASHDKRWSQVEVEAQREYASQGWSVFGDAPSDPADIPCDLYTLIDSRVPLAENPDRATAMLEGAVVEDVSG
ncbi:MAG: PIG-L family deacetylase, partial [Actinobacteria bacterium]|nr:PIG-L family deacetylase [Actinomycetota bacterium]